MAQAKDDLSAQPEWHLLGEGACGTVHATRDAKGDWYAAKTLNGVSVNRNLLERIVTRLQDSWVEAGCVPVLSVDWNARPVCMISPLYADVTEGNGAPIVVPRSLQRHLNAHMRTDKTWDTVLKLADSLAAVHRQRIAHGNLKPGNVFFSQKGRILLTDFAQGWMPEVSHLPYSDALLYSPPEQLVDPAGYMEEAGYRWDVYAFGVLAYRLLEGAFPRCDETFSTVVPAAGSDKRAGIEADRGQIAEAVLATPVRPWQGAVGESEMQRRELIERCLEVDPYARPSTMEEVVAEFDRIALQAELAQERDDVEAAVVAERGELNERIDTAKAKRNKAYKRLAIASAVALAGWGAWASTEAWRRGQNRASADKITKLEDKNRAAEAEKNRALAAEESAKNELAVTRETLTRRLQASREISDRLFSWVLEKGAKDLPALQSREERAEQLQQYYQQFITEHQDEPGWAKEIQRAKLQLAELEVARGRAASIVGQLPGLQQSLRELEMLTPEVRDRLKVIRYRAAQAKLEAGDLNAAAGLFEQVLSAEPENITRRVALVRAKAAAHLGQQAAGRAEYERAQALFTQAVEGFQALGSMAPDLVMPSSEIPQLLISAAEMAEGREALEEAVSLRVAAASGLAKLIEDKPDYAPGLIQLATLERQVAEGKLAQGDRSQCRNALAAAKGYLAKVRQEDRQMVTYRLERAAVLAVDANISRDAGKRTESLGLIKRARRELVGVDRSDADVSYRLALIDCLHSRLAMEGKETALSLELNEAARQSFLRCLALDTWSPLRKRSVRRELAIVCSDAAYTAEEAGKRAEAKKWYIAAGEAWAVLSAEVPTNEEYREAAAWCAEQAR